MKLGTNDQIKKNNCLNLGRHFCHENKVDALAASINMTNNQRGPCITFLANCQHEGVAFDYNSVSLQVLGPTTLRVVLETTTDIS